MLPTRDLLQSQRHTQTESKGMEKDIPCNEWGEKKKSYSVLDKTDFKTKTVNEGHYIIIKGSVQQKDITIINIYGPNTGAPTYVKQILTELKGEIE